MTVPVYTEAERHVHQVYLRHQRREDRIETAVCAGIVLAALISICMLLAIVAGVAWAVARAVG